ncbi:group II intron maturase-specific domain-containing protein, partial [Bacillus sp. SJS]|uniref:group II intron maturase-specific domain-containing protein n=1 Tax=Bacillus sp. SJS TaxID=1423321 RepID=UPI0004DCD0EA
KRRLEEKLKRLTNRNWGVSMKYRILKINQLIQGWGNYFKVADCKKFAEETDSHIRRRLRACRWKEWKIIRTKSRNLMKLGIKKGKAWEVANSRKGYWRNSKNPILHKALPNKYWNQLGLKQLTIVVS